ncbi:hypothetical protein [Arthrobacter sp. zg-Y1171]|uniref:hypothetical protein n=1 Tax=Arthrobacter sp. zg-Y1171 TaxID=2964610 RepID=UPI002104281D|nr:hypothetical protein [Arthrobacter sp. zg-Y1171]MCQ1996488.1 hypothetical protein [Arthrobacter sp. zg-Y1171]UWX82090.1 hypothetical protein N2L00_01210 [Arthrobacter sp. zg-Y1171]
MTESSQLIDGESETLRWLDAPMNFVPRPDPVSPDFRPELRIAVCLLIVEKSRAGKATWKAMHVLSWALQSAKRVEMLANIKVGTALLDTPLVRFEPALDRALDLALGLGFLSRDGLGPFELTQNGREALNEIRSAGVLERELVALAAVNGKVSNKDIERLLEWRSL